MDIPIEIVRANLTEDYVKVQQKISDAYREHGKAKQQFSHILTQLNRSVFPMPARMRNGVLSYDGDSEWMVALEIEALSAELVKVAGRVVDARKAREDGLLERDALIKEAK